jgi:hypothetical protein
MEAPLFSSVMLSLSKRLSHLVGGGGGAERRTLRAASALKTSFRRYSNIPDSSQR